VLEVRKLGRSDRAARIAVGGAILALVYRLDRFDGWTLGGALAAVALLATGLVGWCVLYPLLGLPASRPPGRASQQRA
jgi:hypothetical protein